MKSCQRCTMNSVQNKVSRMVTMTPRTAEPSGVRPTRRNSITLLIASRPRPFGLVAALEGGDLWGLLHGQADAVEAVQQAMFLVRVDVETHDAAVRPADLLGRQVDGDRRIGAARGVVHELFQVLRRDDDRQDAVLKAVVVKNVGEARRDDAGY